MVVTVRVLLLITAAAKVVAVAAARAAAALLLVVGLLSALLLLEVGLVRAFRVCDNHRRPNSNSCVGDPPSRGTAPAVWMRQRVARGGVAGVLLAASPPPRDCLSSR